LLIIALLLLVPLGLRYLVTWHMGQLHLRLVRGDEDLRQLQARLTGVREELNGARRRLRQYQVRGTFIGNDIRRERQHLEALRGLPRTERIAA
jgi:hypothetical protein